MAKPGDTIHGTITSISDSGNGIVESDLDPALNIGPVYSDAVGTNVDVEHSHSTFQRCLTSSVTPPNYDAILELRREESPVSVTVSHHTTAGHGIVTLHREYMSLGPVTCDVGDTVPVESLERGYLKCLSESVQGPNYDSWLETITTSENSIHPLIVTTPDPVNAQTTASGYTINVGPLTCDAGTVVDVEVLEFPSSRTNLIGYVLTDEVTPDGYDDSMEITLKSQLDHYFESVSLTEIYPRIDGRSQSNNGVFTYQGEQYEIGFAPESMVGEIITAQIIGDSQFAFVDKSEWGTPPYSRENVSEIVKRIGGRISGGNLQEEIAGTTGYQKDQYSPQTPTDHLSRTTPLISTSTSSTSTSSTHTSSTPTQTTDSSPTTSSTENPTDLTELRKQAENAATTTPQTNQQTTVPGPRYTRAPEIKAYAKARAAGVCEGCGNSAPFSDKNGDPYLEVHHIHELGDGGTDHPDSVIAICPTCHSRIHYGTDGEEYNAKLAEKVTTLLSQQGR